MSEDPRIGALPDSHGHAKGEHKPFAEERPIPYTARMLFLWFYHACRRGSPRFMMVADHINYLTFEDPAAVHVVRRALKLAKAGDLYGAAETAGVELGHAQVVSEGLRRGMRYSIGAEVDNDPRSRPDAANIVDAMKPDGLIRSVHFLPITHPQHGENWMWAFDNPEFRDVYDLIGTERVWELYMEILLDAIDKLPGHIVGHFYVPAKFGHWPDDAILETYEDRLIDACAERGMAVEINSRYLYKYFSGDDAQTEKFRTVHLRLMRKAKAKGVMISVGSDAHSPRDQGGGFEAVLALLDEAEINEIAFPLGDRLARVALRATEDILRQHSAALAALAAPPPAPARGFMPADPADDDDEASDAEDVQSEVRVETRPEMTRTEMRHDGAELILPPGTEEHIAEEAAAAERLVAETARAEAAAAAKAELDARPKAVPKPRKSRAKAAKAPAPEPAPAAEPSVADVAADTGDSMPQAVEATELVEAAAPAVEAPPELVEASVQAAEATVPPEPAAETTAGEPAAAPVRKARPARAVTVEPAAAPAPKRVASAAKPAKKIAQTAKSAPAAKRVKKAPAKKEPPKKTAAKKSPAKKAATRATSSKKATPLKAAAKKAVAKKAAPKKAAPAKRNAPARKAAAKRPIAKRPIAKKAAKKKSTRR
jgi:HisJ family histidinol phosphate phosphatase